MKCPVSFKQYNNIGKYLTQQTHDMKQGSPNLCNNDLVLSNSEVYYREEKKIQITNSHSKMEYNYIDKVESLKSN